MSNWQTKIVGLGAAFLLAACAGTSPTPRFYTLNAVVPAGERGEANYTVAVGAVTVPALVDRPQMVLRVSENRVEISQFQRWAEPLRDELGRVVAENLSRELGRARVTAYPAAPDRPDFRVQIDVLVFDSRPGEAAILEAVWSVRGRRDGDVRSGRTTAREAVGEGFDALVAAHSQAVARLSADIGGAIRGLQGTNR